MKNLLTIIYIYYNTPTEISDSINSLKGAIKKNTYEIIIVNNNSPKPLPVFSEKHNITILDNKKNNGYGKAVNQGVKFAKGELILIVNPDTIFQKDSVDLMMQKINSDKKIGVLGPQLIDSGGKILHSISSMPNLPDIVFALSLINKIWPNNFYSKKYWAIGRDRNMEQESETVGGAVMLIRKSLFKKIKGFDERFFLYFEEADLCKRVTKAGYKILYYPKAKVVHLVGKSTRDKKFIKRNYEKSRFLFLKKYYGLLPAILTETFLRLPSYIARRK